MVAIGVAEVALGFYSSSSTGRTAGVVIVIIGALALGRGLADLATALDLRPATTPDGNAGGTPAESAKAAGYVAGMADFRASETARSGRARHRAAAAGEPAATAARQSDAERAAADLDAMLALAGVSGAAVANSPTYRASAPVGPDEAFSGGTHVVGAAGDGRPWGATARTGGTAVGERRPAVHSADGTVLARSATMFTGADALEAVDALPSDAYRVPAGPPVASTPSSFVAAPSEAMVQATQTGTVRISPAAAAGTTVRTGVVLEAVEPGTPAPADAGVPAESSAVPSGAATAIGFANEGPVNGSRTLPSPGPVNQNTGNQGTGNRGNANPRGANTGNGNYAGTSEQAVGGTAVRSERVLGRGPGRRRAI